MEIPDADAKASELPTASKYALGWLLLSAKRVLLWTSFHLDSFRARLGVRVERGGYRLGVVGRLRYFLVHQRSVVFLGEDLAGSKEAAEADKLILVDVVAHVCQS